MQTLAGICKQKHTTKHCLEIYFKLYIALQHYACKDIVVNFFYCKISTLLYTYLAHSLLVFGLITFVCSSSFSRVIILTTTEQQKEFQLYEITKKFSCHRVIESKNKDFSVGDLVDGHYGWRTHTITYGKGIPGKPYGTQKNRPCCPHFSIHSLVLVSLGCLGEQGRRK